jgi:CheY-like chemotaxis protein
MVQTQKTILIAEDTAPIAEALQLKLQAIGYTVIPAEDGEIAIQSLKKQKPDLIVTDIMMPKIDGFALVAEAKKSYPDLPIIVFSDLSQKEDHDRMATLGITDFIVKSATSLAETVKKIDDFLKAKQGTPAEKEKPVAKVEPKKTETKKAK